MAKVYQNSTSSQGRIPTFGRKVIEQAKEKVPVEALAERLAGEPGERRGREVYYKCPLPDHDDQTPSFAVNAERGVWFCFGCGRGGDVVSLAAFVWGYGEGEMVMAAAQLLHEFGHPIPARPQSWHRKQARQARVRDAIRQRRVEVLRRRLFRTCMLPLIRATVPEDELRAEMERAWRDFQTVPVEDLLDRMAEAER